MKINVKKANRIFADLAALLCWQSDATIDAIHAIINDEKDGYFFNFKSVVEAYRRILVK